MFHRTAPLPGTHDGSGGNMRRRDRQRHEGRSKDQRGRNGARRESLEWINIGHPFRQGPGDAPSGQEAASAHGSGADDKKRSGPHSDAHRRRHAEGDDLGGVIQAARKAQKGAGQPVGRVGEAHTGTCVRL